MATDSAELTFVRCRSCGALVPATATKCRICNAALDGASKLDEAGSDNRGSRVRQRTMSAPSGDLMEAVQKLRDEDPPAAFEDDSSSATQGDNENTDSLGDDPLGAYLEEVDEASAPVEAGSSADLDDSDDDTGLDADPLDSFESDTVKPFSEFEEPIREKSRESAGRRPFAMDSDMDDFDEPPPVKKPVSPFVRPSSEEPRRPSRFERPTERTPRERKEESRGGSRLGTSSQRGDRERSSSRSEERMGRGETLSSSSSSVAKHSPVAASATGKGKLCGWLVSYSEDNGVAIELREGKYFVTGSSFKGTDLVVEDPSVSTPHALLSISTQTGIRVQDLMSENGLFTKSVGGSDFQGTDGPVTLRHGDWVKFGDVEFLICTVARDDAK